MKDIRHHLPPLSHHRKDPHTLIQDGWHQKMKNVPFLPPKIWVKMSHLYGTFLPVTLSNHVILYWSDGDAFFDESLCYFVPFMGHFCLSPCPISLYNIWVTHLFGESLCYFVPLSHSIIWYILFEMHTIHQSILSCQTKISHYPI